ncbi:LPD7 domain-containing protein [Photobacterium carnosum]|uniref:LPD7 domain-containing protein n=1 Tax=Photobacterium carnosum TaxID=2023717 RepID=UPI00128D903B|nr:LPD7 domain-containing protein [Photobacterium carnosum]KAE8175731.1 hypothetical protein CIT27_16860 [Photobacterium carnosum]MCD9531660.1 hypothetical protein [Photobacterium carnosum]MCD9554379.1 hypothetical protein [Photobacterium carnosum]
MLARVSGGNSGVEDYLEFGEKKDREQTRDELDERVILDGDLDQTRQVIAGIHTQAERYLHITLAFKEDHIPPEVLQAISDEYKAFAMTAYDNDEYHFYSEAHLPKIKTLQDKRTGELIERKPHIHIVIPKVNLLTGERLDPFELVERQKDFTDAFNEVINEKYGLASPKVNLRTSFNTSSEIVSRHKGDTFEGQGKTLKETAFKTVMASNIQSLTALTKTLTQQGFDVRVRNAKTDNPYLNIKLKDNKGKGVNLKEAVFRTDFLAQSLTDKHAQLSIHQPQQYVKPQSHAHYRATPKQHQNLKQWHQHGAAEVRYIGRRNRDHFKTLTPTDKLNYLVQKKEDNHERNQRIRAELPSRQPSRTINHYLQESENYTRQSAYYIERIKQHSGNIGSGAREHLARRHLRTIITNLQQHRTDQGDVVIPVVRQRERRNDRTSQALVDVIDLNEPDFYQLKKSLDAKTLLKSLQDTHGIIVEKYPITSTPQGDRVLCGSRQLNVSDFMTKEMNLSWKETRQYLLDEHQRQQHLEIKPAIAPQWQQQLQSEQFRRTQNKIELNKTKRFVYNDKSLSAQERKTLISISTLNKVLEDMKLKVQIQQERFSLANTVNIYKEEITMPSIKGQFIEAGEDIYTQKGQSPQPNKKPTPYMKINTGDKEEKVYGADLKRILKENPTLKPNDDINLSYEMKPFSFKDSKTNKLVTGNKKEFSLSREKNLTGKVIEHGKGELTVNGKIRKSYFVTLEKEGIQTKEWGLNLENTLKLKDIKQGDNIQLNKRTDTIIHEGKERKINLYTVDKQINETSVELSTINPVVDPQAPTLAELNRHLKAINIINAIPELKDKGITTDNIVQTKNGEKIVIEGKEKALQTVIKENTDMKMPEVFKAMKKLYFEQEGIKPEPTLTIEPAKTKEIKQDTSNEKPQSPPINNKPIQPETPINNERKYPPIKRDFNHQGFGDIHYKENDKNKHITYFEKTVTDNGKDKFNKLIIDRGDNIKVIDKYEKSIEMALLLSIEKYGKELDIKGSEQYKDQVINIIAKNGLDIQLTDKAMMDKLIERQHDYQRVDNIIQAKKEVHEPQQPQQQTIKETPNMER